MARDWSELPQELLELIASKSDDISDHIRFGAVCTSWRSAASNHNIRRYYPWIRGYNIEASCRGWLLLEGEGSIFLLNPLAMAQIALPEFPVERHGRVLYAHMSSDPLSDDCVIVCRVEPRPQVLLLCVPGDKAWSSVGPDELEGIEEECEIICREGGLLPTIYCRFPNTSLVMQVLPKGQGTSDPTHSIPMVGSHPVAFFRGPIDRMR